MRVVGVASCLLRVVVMRVVVMRVVGIPHKRSSIFADNTFENLRQFQDPFILQYLTN